VGNAWDPAKDEADGNQCKAYGAAAIMRVPGRLNITWENDNTLKIQTDAGTQTRMINFGAAPAGGAPSWQGTSVGQWERHGGAQTSWAGPGGGGPGGPGGGPGGAAQRSGALRVVTNNLKAGYLRKNGVPYSANAVVTEYFDRVNESNGDSWLIVTTIVEDPQYLAQPFVTSTHFKKQADASGWNPTPCTAR
jgi:hypothetical protein